MKEGLTEQDSTLTGSFDEAMRLARDDFIRKSPKQRLEWLEAAQKLYRIGEQRAGKRAGRVTSPAR